MTIPNDHPLRRARWIWPADLFAPLHNVFADFVTDFEHNDDLAAAPLFVTADQSYQLWINGEYVGRGPARGYQRSWPFDEHDVAPLLRHGTNRLAARVYNPGCGTFAYRHDRAAGLLLAAGFEGGPVSGAGEWRGRIDPSHRRLTPLLSVQLPYAEVVDLRATDEAAWPEELNVLTPPATLRWHPPETARPFGSPPWHDVEPRGVPDLTSDVEHIENAVAVAAGPASPVTNDPAADFDRDARAATWGETDCEWKAIVYDLGRPVVGTPRLTFDAASGGEVIDLLFVEALDGGRPVLVPGGARLAARLTLRPGRNEWESFHTLGFRHLAVARRGGCSPPSRVEVRHTRYPLDVVGDFACGDDLLNRVHRASVVTQRACMTDAYVDTPWREQAQWWGDARVQFANTVHLADDARLLARGVRSLAGQQLPNGLLYGHAPTIAHNCVLPDFNLTWLLTLRDHWWQTGSPDLFAELWPTTERVLGYFAGEGRDEATGLLRHDPRYWLFLDWADVHRTGVPTLLNLWYDVALANLIPVAASADMREIERMLTAEHAAHRERMTARLLDGGLWRDGLGIESHGVHAQALAMLAGLGTEATAGRVRSLLTDDDPVEGPTPGAFWMTHVYQAADAAGMGRDVVRHLRRHWRAMAEYGSTFEGFDGTPGRESLSHAWSAHPIYHLPQILGGVRQTAPMWRRVSFRPLPDMPEVDHCRTTLPTPHGRLRVEWRRDGTMADVALTVPDSVTVDVELPGITTIVGGGRHEWHIEVGEPK